MTSPAQLKYLDAIGIPVWVSRDLVIEESIQKIHEPSVVVGLTTENNAAIESSKSADQNNHSAQSILQSLDDTSTRINKPAKGPEDKSKIIHKDKLPVADTKIIPNPNTQQNLLTQTSEHYVYASGSKSADWMIIGHSAEIISGIGQQPFTGEGGILLDNMLRAVGLNQPRSDAYLVNVLDLSQTSKTNKNAQKTLTQNLLALVSEVNPKIVLFVGQRAAQNLLDITDPLIIMRSKIHKLNDNIPCVVTYYPDYLLQKPTDKRKAWDDLKLAMSQLTD